MNHRSMISPRVLAMLLIVSVVSGFAVYRVYTSSEVPGPTPIKHVPGNTETPPPLTKEEKKKALDIALNQPLVKKLLEASNGNYTVLFIIPRYYKALFPDHRLVQIYLKFNKSVWIEGDFYLGIHSSNNTYVHRKLWTRVMEVLVDLNTSRAYLDTGISSPGGHHYEPELDEAMPLIKQYLKLVGAEEIKDIALLAVYYDYCYKGLVIVRAEITMDNHTKYYLVAVDLCKNRIDEEASGEILTVSRPKSTQYKHLGEPVLPG